MLFNVAFYLVSSSCYLHFPSTFLTFMFPFILFSLFKNFHIKNIFPCVLLLWNDCNRTQPSLFRILLLTYPAYTSIFSTRLGYLYSKKTRFSSFENWYGLKQVGDVNMTNHFRSCSLGLLLWFQFMKWILYLYIVIFENRFRTTMPSSVRRDCR